MSEETNNLNKDQFIDYIFEQVIAHAARQIMEDRYSPGGMYRKAEERVAEIMARKYIAGHEMEILGKLDIDKIAHALNIMIVKGLADSRNR
jgi:hypothetical protein